MPLPVPNLDDRTFEQLVAEAKAKIRERCPSWTDLSVHDPGIALVEVFAYLTEVMLYRFNRIPERVYVELLNLIGVYLQPPSAARAELTFSVSKPDPNAGSLLIPRGTRVTTSRGSSAEAAPIFVTTQNLEIPKGSESAVVTAIHCDVIAGEIVGVGTGLPGLSLKTRQAPLLARTGTDVDLRVAVEVRPSISLEGQEDFIALDGSVYRLWREVEQFADATPADPVYVIDRHAGLIQFAPAARMAEQNGVLREVEEALGAIPELGMRIAAWYAIGGGASGNVAAGALDTLRTPIAGVSVTNQSAATGGRSAESVQNALVRGPAELYSLRRAVTARDYEAIAERLGAVTRARALTRAASWKFARPGAVDVILVPAIPADQLGENQRELRLERLNAFQTPAALEEAQRELDMRRPLGTECKTSWARYKQVSVAAKLTCRSGEDPLSLKRRITDRIYLRLSPIGSAAYPAGWGFGQSLGTDTIYAIVLSEPGILRVDSLKLIVADVPRDVNCLVADPLQAGVWFAGAGGVLFRSLNDAAGWEPTNLKPNGPLSCIRVHDDLPGLLATSTSPGPDFASEVWVSRDSGESWAIVTRLKGVNDLAWIERAGGPALLIASDSGLHQLTLGRVPGQETTPIPVVVDPQKRQVALGAIATTSTATEKTVVAVAAKDRQGVYLSIEGGHEGTFRPDLAGEQITVLAVQTWNSRLFIWAGTGSTGNDPGKGCFRREIAGTWSAMPKWEQYSRGWQGESIYDLAFSGSRVFAASHSKGVLALDAAVDNAEWGAPELRSGLFQRAANQPFLPVHAVSVGSGILMAGGSEGIVQSRDGRSFTLASKSEFGDGTRITIPESWLICSGTHDIQIAETHA